MAEETIQIACKNCGSTDVVKAGFQSGVQRYLCHTCKRKFKADDTPFHGKVSAGHISSALAMYYTGSSITDRMTATAAVQPGEARRRARHRPSRCRRLS